LIAIADQMRAAIRSHALNGLRQTLSSLYTLLAIDFYQILRGSNGGFTARKCYNEVTGVGNPITNFLVPNLAAYGNANHLAVTARPRVVHGSLSLQVAAEDRLGQVDTSFHGLVHLSLSNVPRTVTLSGTRTVRARNGVASFAALALAGTPSGATLTVSNRGLAGTVLRLF
jgi:hypothetical protein